MSLPTPATETMRRPSLDLTEPSRNLEESNGPPSDDSMDTDVDLAMPPNQGEDDDDDNDDDLEQDPRIYTPPPRIAARFYRPSATRRRDSAASSRRNSISSAHSRCSSIQPSSHRGPVQSKHVAQHLRRASFLEDRKARLADRAAHAEKVRLRAALAKATHRDTSASEEKALAAQQARERNLAEIVASCAEEVKKAKQVAEFMKEKREQELIKMRAQIEERMAEAEKRREELRAKNATRRSRGQSVMARKPVEVMPQVTEREVRALTEDEATGRIQGWWRGCLREKTIQEFTNLGLTVDGIRDTNFDTVVELLAQEKVLLITARLLRTCGLHEGDPGSVGEMAAVRTFLSAFLILGHPNQVLANKNDNEDAEVADALSIHRLPSTSLANPQLQDLVGKARDLLISFENILARLTSANRYTMPPALKKTLPEAYATFYNAFIAWKSRDSNALIEVMLMQFVELDAIFHTVKDTTDDAATALYKKSIQDNQLMIIVRIKKLAGPEKGKKLIFDAVAEARKSRSTKKKTGDTKPRVAESASSEASETANSLVSPDSQTLTPPATPASKSQSKRADTKTGLNGLLPDNRVVVHELAINKEYQITPEEYQEQQAVIARPVFMQMRDNMATPNPIQNEVNFHFFIVMAGNIKEKLQRLLKPGNSMYNLIGEILDPEMAERQFKVGNFSYEKFFTVMASLLPKLCAPFRDEEVKDLVQNKLADGDLIDRVESLHSFIDIMLCDYINYLMRIAAPQLIESAAQYEAKMFAQDVEKTNIGLAGAESAWRSARSKIMTEIQKRDPEGINHPRSRPTAGRIYAQMLVDVFTRLSPASEDEIPEMLRLDQNRISEVSTMVQRIITVGAVLLQCKNLLKRDVRSSWKTEASRIMTVLESQNTLKSSVEGTMLALEAGRSMPTATKSHLRALVTKVLLASQDMATQGTEPREPVLRLLLTRLRGNIHARLAPGSASEKVKAANTAGEKLASLGLSEFVDKVRQISDLLDRVGAVDRAAHGPWWDAVSTKVEQEDMSP
ncbi:T-complex protein 11-domain-containing protein [Dactylonectria macrodidyma]|uniref:T-complex protein 11-domain-containing protein n=1 Tax=Dactylonectria macrodidyma TaxID=307937 RepID=A0A9P9JBF8_9HYPO|nr:T-complex protein 11-domain-containing protein [Dactylonectria macrodidyma]